MNLSKIEVIIITGFISLAILLFGSWFLKYYMKTLTIFSAIGVCFIGALLVMLQNYRATRLKLKRHDLNKTSIKNNSEFSLPGWLIGSDVMVQFNISLDILIEHIRNGLPAYPAGILHDVTRDEAPPLTKDDIEWLLSSPVKEFELLCFKTAEVEEFIKKNPT